MIIARRDHTWRARLCLGALSLLASCSSSRTPDEPAPARPEHSSDLEPFLTSYFSTWSRGDMEGYQDHFHEDATIVLVENGRLRARMPLEPFIEQQASMQRDPETRAAERMTGFRAHEDRVAASVTVDWELERDGRPQRGVDRFTLIRNGEGEWKIATLVFYSTER